MICNYYNFIFIDICKTAGTAINQSFIKKFKDDKEIKFKGKHHSIPNYTIAISSKITAEDIIKYRLFTVVRNPYDRIVSLYLWGSGTCYKKCKDFKEFVINVSNNKYKEYNRHRYRPQLHWLMDKNNNVVVDNILRYENLNEDFENLLIKFNIPLFKIKKTNTAFQKTGVNRKHYSYYYDQETKDIVTDLYQVDLDYFNYTFEDI
jgi:hypothetical protein